MRLSQESIQRMISGRSGGGVGGGGSFDPSALAGYATQAWTEENYISKTFFNELFVIHKKVTTVVMDGETEISRTVTTNSVFAPNEIPGTTTETDEETGYVTTVTTEIASIESKKGFWTNYFLSALGLNGEGGGGGATLFEPLLSINESGLAAPTDAQDGMTVVWDKNTHKWKYGATGGGSGEYLPLTGGTLTGNLSIKGAHDLSLANNGITDSNRRYYGYYIKDANNKRSAQYINTVSPDGNNAFWMSVTYGFDQTTGIEQDKGFGLTVDKQGNCTWSVSDPAAFRTAIGVNFDNFVTINTDQTITGKKTFTRDIVLTNNHAINFKNTSDAECNILSFNSSDNIVLGWGVRNTSENYICGKTIQMAVYDATDINAVRSVFFANNAGNVAIGTISPYTKLDVNGGVKATKFYLYKPNANNDTGAVYFQYVSGQSGVQLVGAGFFTESYVSALGANSAGGGGASSLSELSDVQLSSPSNGQALIYDSSIGKWRNGAAGIDMTALTTYLTSKVLTIKNGSATLGTWNPTAAGVIDIASAVSGYLPLTGGSLTGNLNIVYSHDLSKTNNGVSDTLWPGYRIYDKDGRRSAQFVNGVYSDGSNFVWMSVSNYNTEGTQIADYGIGLSVDKSGNASYTVSQPAAFRTAIDALSKTEINSYTWWGRALSNGVVNGDMTNVGNISFSASGKNIGGLMSFVTAGNGTVGVGTLSPNTNYKLDVNGYTKTSRLYLSDTIYMVVQNDGIHIVGGGLYADTYVSALGLSDSGGSAFDESAMWIALGTNISQKQISSTYLTNALAPYALKTDIPSLKSLSWSYGSVTSASGSSYNGSTATSFVIPKNTSHLVNDSGFVTSSALGSYLPLSGGTLTGNLNIKYSHDLSKSNNGVSDTLWPGYRIFDKDGRRSAQFVNGVYSSGSNFVWMGVSNYDTNGDMIADYGIGLSIDKNGAGTWSVSEPAAFRTAIGIPALLGGYLPLTGGTMTGTLKVATGSGIEDATGNGLLVYHPTNWSGVSASQWGAGAADCQGVIRSDASDLKHYRGGTSYNILDSYNSGVIDGKVTLNSTSLNVPISYNLPTPGTFTSGYWHRLGNYVTAGDGNNIVITIYDGTGYNGYAEQNSIARIVIKDGWQSTRAAANSVGVSIERFAYFFDLQVSVVATEHNAGALWVYLPWQYAQGTYTVEGIYTSWEHHNGTDGDTTTAPVTNQTFDTSSQHSYLYFDYAYLTSNVASATKLQTTRYIWGNAFDGTADINGNLIMPNNRGIVIKDTNGVEQNVFVYNQNNDVVIGWGPRSTSDTYITGNTISIARNGGANGFYLNTSNNIGLGGAGDSSHKLYVQGSTLLKHSGGESLTLDTTTTYNCIVYQINAASKWSVGTDANGTFYWYTQPGGNNTVMSLTSAGILNVGNSVKCTDLWIGNIHITYDSTNGGIHVANGGLSANTYVSALGVGQEGGGSQGLDIEAMWTELATPNSARQIDSSHISSALSNYVTTNTLSSYATQQWVNQQGFVKTSGVTSVAMSVPSSLRVNTGSGATITTSGTFAITLASGYSIPTTEKQSNWDTAYGWGNHANAGYSTPQGVATQMQSYAYISGNVIHIGDNSITPLTSHQSVDGTFWGRSWSNHGTVSGSIEAGSSGGYIGGFDHIDLNTHASLYGYGGYIDFYYNGANSYTSRIIEEDSGLLALRSPYTLGLLVGGYNGDYVQIGQIRIVYESSNNALRIENANNGGAANLYAMGGISALGMSGNADGTISGNLIPSTNATYSIGSSSYGWKELRLSQYGVSGRITIDGDGINIVSNEGGYLSGALYMVTGRMIVGASDDDYDGFTFATEGTSYLSSKVSIGGTNSNSDKLYVNGSMRSSGISYASSHNNTSDARLKNIIGYEEVDVETIARAPLIKFTWKDGDSRVHIGTTAQYWLGTELHDVIEQNDYLSMDYATTALASVISVARKVMTHEERIAALEAENERLRNEIETLKAA